MPPGPPPAAPLASVLFVCVHNAGRSQMAAGFLAHLAGDRVEVRSAGSLPADQINPVAVEAMREVGVDLSVERPKALTAEAVRASDYVITMGCGDACPVLPGRRYLDWDLADPAGRGIEAVRPIRDAIRRRVEALIAEIDSAAPGEHDPCPRGAGPSEAAGSGTRHGMGKAGSTDR